MWEPPKFGNPFEERDLKRAFAAAWLENLLSPMDAACSIGLDNGQAAYAAMNWTKCPEVLAYKEALIAEKGSDALLPTKEELARAVYERAQRALEDKDAATLFKLYADIRGFIEKGPSVHIGDNVQNNVITQVLEAIDGTSRGLPKICRDNERPIQETQRNLPN